MTLEAQATSLRQELAKEAYTINYTLAKNPEISSQEFKSAALICDMLEAHGMTVTRELAGLPTAFKAAVVRSSQPQGRLAILCEYDALPEIGHACGHCASGSSSVLAALTLHALAAQLAENGNDLGVDVDIIGTPDEEAAGGKVDLVKAGVFDGYDFAMMVHMAGVETRANADFLALDDYRVAFHGKPAHAAGEPWNGINALNGAQLALQALDMLRQQVRPETRIGYYIVKGGSASNIIPDYAEIEVCVRHTERAYLDTVVARVMKCLEGAALATGTTHTVTQFGQKYDNMRWNETGTAIIEEVMDSLSIPYVTGHPTEIGSSDIGNVSYVCPAFHPELRLKGDDKVCHTKEFAAAMEEPTIETTINEASDMIIHTMLRLAQHPEELAAIKKEFMAQQK